MEQEKRLAIIFIGNNRLYLSDVSGFLSILQQKFPKFLDNLQEVLVLAFFKYYTNVVIYKRILCFKKP